MLKPRVGRERLITLTDLNVSALLNKEEEEEEEGVERGTNCSCKKLSAESGCWP